MGPLKFIQKISLNLIECFQLKMACVFRRTFLKFEIKKLLFKWCISAEEKYFNFWKKQVYSRVTLLNCQPLIILYLEPVQL